MRTVHVRPALGLVLCWLLVVAGCGQGDDVRSTGDQPITQRAIAAVALDHLPHDTTTREATYTDKGDPEGALGADLRYDGDGEDDGGLLRVFISPKVEKDPCGNEYLDGCTKQGVDGKAVVLRWTEEEPEEDPGQIEIVAVRHGAQITVTWSGDIVKGDPRKQDLAISIDQMTAVALDQRLRLTTSRHVIDAGEQLEHWDGGEPEMVDADVG